MCYAGVSLECTTLGHKNAIHSLYAHRSHTNHQIPSKRSENTIYITVQKPAAGPPRGQNKQPATLFSFFFSFSFVSSFSLPFFSPVVAPSPLSAAASPSLTSRIVAIGALSPVNHPFSRTFHLHFATLSSTLSRPCHAVVISVSNDNWLVGLWSNYTT